MACEIEADWAWWTVLDVEAWITGNEVVVVVLSVARVLPFIQRGTTESVTEDIAGGTEMTIWKMVDWTV